jgi:hypothetical protein
MNKVYILISLWILLMASCESTKSVIHTEPIEFIEPYHIQLEKIKEYKQNFQTKYDDPIKVEEGLLERFPTLELDTIVITCFQRDTPAVPVYYYSLEELKASYTPCNRELLLSTTSYWHTDVQRWTILHEFQKAPTLVNEPMNVFWFQLMEKNSYDYLHLDVYTSKNSLPVDGYVYVKDVSTKGFHKNDYIQMEGNYGMEGLAFWVDSNLQYGELWISPLHTGTTQLGYKVPIKGQEIQSGSLTYQNGELTFGEVME